MNTTLRSIMLYLSIGILFALLGGLGVLLLDGHKDVHFHANIAIFIDGKKVDLSDQKYMEETTKCAIDPSRQHPEDRTHFHENNGDLVHVHAAGVTWGHLMSNIGWDFGRDYLVDESGKKYQKSASGSIHFILNGKPVDNPFNRLINSEDRLLIDYGTASDDTLIKTEFPQVVATAHEFNTKADPNSCAGVSAYNFLDSVRDLVHGH